MLNVERRPDADARVQQFLDVLPAFGMARQRFTLGDIRMRQLIDEDGRGPAPQRGVEIELIARDAAVRTSSIGRRSSPSSKRSVSMRPWGST